jgi:tetratricopeptide (TPR) repeat protein
MTIDWQDLTPDHWHSWFEQDLLLDQPNAALHQLLALAGGPVRACEAAYHSALGNPHPDAPAAVVVAAVTGIWDRGRAFEGLSIWLQRASEIGAADSPASPLARASVSTFALIGELLWRARLHEVRRLAPIAQERVEQADSEPLRIFLATFTAYLHLMAGELHAAQQCLDDAAHFAPRPGRAMSARLHLAACSALLEGIVGRAGQGEATLREIQALPNFAQLPTAVQVMVNAHHLHCLAQTGSPQAIAAEVERLRGVVVPGNRAYHRSYMHFSLGQAELMHGQPARALTHARMALDLAKVCDSVEAVFFPGLLIAQALIDLGREDEALAHMDAEMPHWQAQGFMLNVIAAHIERARVRWRQGQIDAARAELDQARGLLPAGESLPDFNRPAGFTRGIVDALEGPRGAMHGAPVRIRALGNLDVQVGARHLYDRDWRGNQAKTLLKAILSQGGYKISVDRLCDLLWPDSDGATARQNLKVAVWRLRKVMRDAGLPDVIWLAVNQGQVSIVQACCDVDAMRFAAIPADAPTETLREALSWYEGDFLALDDSAPWILVHREALSLHRQRLADALAQATGRPQGR